MLGLGTVRTLAISYCMTGVHNQLGLSGEEARMLWEPALCKAVAAKQYMRRVDPEREDEGFLGGMLQDLALTVMYAIGRDAVLAPLKDEQLSCRNQLETQRALFGRDHAQAGRILAQKLNLPDLLVDVITLHHDRTLLCEYLECAGLASACYVASLFPHLLNVWNSDDAEELCCHVGEQCAELSMDASVFLADVQVEFDKLYRFFENGVEPEIRLAELLQAAACEAAGQTEHLVLTVRQLQNEAATTDVRLKRLLERQTGLQRQAHQDPLTGVFNREGLRIRGEELLAKAVRYGVGVALVYLDFDRFKSINDTLGHDVGDLALERVAGHMQSALRTHDIAARLGGDEFVLLLYDCTPESAVELTEALLHTVAGDAIGHGTGEVHITLSAGCLWIRPTGKPVAMQTLISAADQLMYKAKREGGNQTTFREVRV